MIDVPIRVKDALKHGRYLKNFRIEVYDPEDQENMLFEIDNNNLFEESIDIDERMCTGKELKFGLCEGSNIEFKYFGFPNINGKRIKVFIDIQYKNESEKFDWYHLPIGWFDVKSCPMEFDTGIMKAKAYNKLQSDYLDRNATADIQELVAKGEAGVKGAISLDSLLYEMLQGYAIEAEYEKCDYKIVSNTYTLMNEDSVRWDGDPLINGHFIGTYQWQGRLVPYYGRCVIEISEWDEGEYYRISVNAKKLYEFWKSIYAMYYTHDDYPYFFYDADVQFAESDMHIILGEYAELLKDNSIYDYCNFASGEIIIEKYNTVTADAEHIGLFKNKAFNSDIYNTEYDTNVFRQMYIFVPCLFGWENMGIPDNHLTVNGHLREIMEKLVTECIEIHKRVGTEIGKIELSNDMVVGWNDVTLRDLQSSVFEMNCQFGRLNRETDLFAGLGLNSNRLLPSNSLYPSDSLYPKSDSERSEASSYEKLWTDSAGVQKYRYLIITYQGIGDDGNLTEKKLQRTIHEDGTVNYNMSNNWLFKNLVWSNEQIGLYADAMVAKMQNVSWIPFEMWSAGMPYLEPGDELEITNKEGTFTSYILQRKMKGIQYLTDDFINGELDVF